MGLGGVAIATLPSVIFPKLMFSDRLGGRRNPFNPLSETKRLRIKRIFYCPLKLKADVSLHPKLVLIAQVNNV